MKTLKIFLSLVLLASPIMAKFKQGNAPAGRWQQYSKAMDAGYSQAGLDSARAFFNKSRAAGLFIVHRGNVLAAWGETNRRFICASIRKSFISALFGMAVGEKAIDLGKSLQQLQINDIQKLSEIEKQATVKHLLTARSGVFHPAAYSPRNMIANLPERGSHNPGEFWYYNNWDFNVLATIFKHETGKGVFEAFEKEIAKPLRMQDLLIEHTYYRLEPNKSEHPAYLFRMTARDMARFGLLYLNKGAWRGKQIIPSPWIATSTQAVTKETGRHSALGGYGYLWWVSAPIRGQDMYFASGSGGQKIAVLPEAELVVVQVVDTYQNDNVDHNEFKNLIDLLLAARVSEPATSPALVSLKQKDRTSPKGVKLTEKITRQYHGTFRHRFLGEFKISGSGGRLKMEAGIGVFDLTATAENVFWVPDIEQSAVFKQAQTDDKKFTIDPVFDENRRVVKVIFNY